MFYFTVIIVNNFIEWLFEIYISMKYVSTYIYSTLIEYSKVCFSFFLTYKTFLLILKTSIK
uniref:Uncharacterized protein n=1 Tax=Anguilla anguilla TaxID=7936 RepID=A0A0E9PB53_ANGAN